MYFVTKNHGDYPILRKNLKIKSKDCPLPLDANLEAIKQLMPFPFKLYDSEGEIYYEGFYDGANGTDEQALEPLIWSQRYTDCKKLEICDMGEWFELVPEMVLA